MSTRDEISDLFDEASSGLADAQVMATLGGDTETFNVALYESRHEATKAALLVLADKIDALRQA